MAPALHKPPRALHQRLQLFMKLRAVKGMNDILPDEAQRFERVERIFRDTVEAYGFRELRTPIVEELDLFHKSTGETSEVVQKQMFVLPRESTTLALRPEGTPSCARVYISKKMQAIEPVTKWYYIGPMFRAENVQRGRQRQFHQAGCELYGDSGPLCDAEMIDMLATMATSFGLTDVVVQINSLGGQETRAAYRERLQAFFGPKSDSLSEHAKARLLDNPLRILDSKDPRDQQACEGAPVLLDCLTSDDRAHFDALRTALDRLGTSYVVNDRLVRGLDYYSRTCFEVIATTGDIGSQSAILGGGRYDGMLESLGGESTPAIGFALGLERLLLALGDQIIPEKARVFVAPIGEEAQLAALQIAKDLRVSGITTELDTRGNSLKSMLRRANTMGARFCIVLGKSELEKSQVQLKDLSGHEQKDVPLVDIVSTIRSAISSPEQER